MRALFIGAGASCGTFEGSADCPPVTKHFGRALKEAAPNWEDEYPGLREVVTHLGRRLEKLSMEEIWTCIDYCAKLGTVLPRRPQWDPYATRDLKRALLLLYGSRCDQLAERLSRSRDYTLGELVSRLAPGDILISFNYDTIAERLATRFGHDVRTAFPSYAKNVVQLAKPHGSVSWRMEGATHRVLASTADGKPELEAIRPEEVGPDVEPLLLGAVPIKSELIREVQSLYGWSEVFEVVVRQWRLITHAVRHAESFVVAGYGFPKEDQYGGFLLREAMRTRTTVPTVEFYELEKHEKRTKKAIRHAFGCEKLSPQPKGPVGRGRFTKAGS
jgi:hypothetical protein